MSNDDDLGEELNVGEWSKRVAYSERGGFAYRPGQVFVQGARGDEAASLLGTRPSQASALVREPSGTYERIAGVDDTIDGIEFLRAEGLPAHPNHVMFSHCQCCCGPHPANLFSANPFSSNPFSVQPVLLQPVLVQPVLVQPVLVQPVGRQLGELRPAEPAPAAGDGRVRTGDAGVPAIRPATALRPPGGRSVPAPASAHRWRPAAATGRGHRHRHRHRNVAPGGS